MCMSLYCAFQAATDTQFAVQTAHRPQRLSAGSSRDTEQLFADYMAQILRSIGDERTRRRAEFRLHCALFEFLSDEDRGSSAPLPAPHHSSPQPHSPHDHQSQALNLIICSLI